MNLLELYIADVLDQVGKKVKNFGIIDAENLVLRNATRVIRLLYFRCFAPGVRHEILIMSVKEFTDPFFAWQSQGFVQWSRGCQLWSRLVQ